MLKPLLPALLAATAGLTAQSASAQTRLLQDEDLPGRARAAAAFEAILEDGPDLLPSIALAATGGVHLAPGSAARALLTDALRRAHTADDEARALDRLRLDLGDLVDVLSFRPVDEAELPAGFPGYRAVGELELRRYPAYRLVRTAMNASGSNGAFWPLFQHIKKNDIAMTSPVQTDYAADDARSKASTMAFLYGDPETTPKVVSDRVEVVDVPAMTVLSLGATGYDRPDLREAMERRLRAFVAASDGAWEVAGPMRTMGYNSPMVRGERRYYEVQLPVRRAAVIR